MTDETPTPKRGRFRRKLVVGGLATTAALSLAIPTAFAQESDDAPETETPSPESEAPEGAPAPEEGPRCHGGGHAAETAAEVIGIEPDALREQLESGASIAEVAEANDVDPQTVVDALVADMNERIEQGLEDGRLTEEEAAEKQADAAERAEELVNRPGDERPERPEGAPQVPPADEDDAETTES